MLARIATAHKNAVRGVHTMAVRSVAAAATVPVPQLAQSQQRQRQQQQQQQPGSSSFRWLGAVAATGALFLGVAACERVVEQPTGGGVNYAQVREAIEDALEKEGSATHSTQTTHAELTGHPKQLTNRPDVHAGEGDGLDVIRHEGPPALQSLTQSRRYLGARPSRTSQCRYRTSRGD
jgi:hypothetical protein